MPGTVSEKPGKGNKIKRLQETPKHTCKTQSLAHNLTTPLNDEFEAFKI
jgi:hypothetical protein